MKKVEVRANLIYKFTMDIPDEQSVQDTLMDSRTQDPYWNKLKQVLGRRDWISVETVDIVDEDTNEVIWSQGPVVMRSNRPGKGRSKNNVADGDIGNVVDGDTGVDYSIFYHNELNPYKA